MSKIARYNLNEFNRITFDGFDFKLPDETVNIISELSLQVGSPSYVKTPVFQKRENPLKTPQSNNINAMGLKKKRSKNLEVLKDDDWETLRTFQTTKIEQKVGLEAKFDTIRSYLNKLSDKSYLDLKNKILEMMETIICECSDGEEILRFGTSIFEIASTNRFYSKLYADLYAELISNFDIMREVFYNSFDTFLEIFNKSFQRLSRKIIILPSDFSIILSLLISISKGDPSNTEAVSTTDRYKSTKFEIPL